MNTEDLVYSLSKEDLQEIFRCNGEDPSGTIDELQMKALKRFEMLPWNNLLTCVPKESLQRICDSCGLRSDLSKDELIAQIAKSKPKPPKKRSPLRNLFSLWQR